MIEYAWTILYLRFKVILLKALIQAFLSGVLNAIHMCQKSKTFQEKGQL